MHDFRESGRSPLRFGYKTNSGLQGRFPRGAMDNLSDTIFVSGGKDGLIRIWDLRNTASPRQKVTKIIFFVVL